MKTIGWQNLILNNTNYWYTMYLQQRMFFNKRVDIRVHNAIQSQKDEPLHAHILTPYFLLVLLISTGTKLYNAVHICFDIIAFLLTTPVAV